MTFVHDQEGGMPLLTIPSEEECDLQLIQPQILTIIFEKTVSTATKGRMKFHNSFNKLKFTSFLFVSNVMIHRKTELEINTNL